MTCGGLLDNIFSPFYHILQPNGFSSEKKGLEIQTKRIGLDAMTHKSQHKIR